MIHLHFEATFDDFRSFPQLHCTVIIVEETIMVIIIMLSNKNKHQCLLNTTF